MSAPVAVFDANIMFSASLRDFLMWLGIEGACRPIWTETIHGEWMENVLLKRAGTLRSSLERTRDLMNATLPGALVTNYESLIPTLTLPDENDRHVLAAAIHGGANSIVTFNLTDFPSDILGQFEVAAIHPDDFVLSLLEANPSAVLKAAQCHRASLKKRPKSPEEYLQKLNSDGLGKTADKLRDAIDLI
jgi:predicted nucleic acid-binding protein